MSLRIDRETMFGSDAHHEFIFGHDKDSTLTCNARYAIISPSTWTTLVIDRGFSMFPLHLPPTVDIKPVFEHRTRYERRTDQDLSNAKNDNRSLLLNRERVGFDFTYDKKWSGEFRFQYSHNQNWSEARNFSEESRDLYVGHVDYSIRPREKLSVGRQIVRSGRLFDPSDYIQRGRVFDLIRYTTKSLDLFVGRVGMNSSLTDHAKLASAAYTTRFGKSTVTYKRDDQDLDISTYTLDQQFSGKTKHYSYVAEGAVQFGKTGGKDVNAFFVHARAVRPIDAKLGIYAEANMASGGGNGNQTRTFDPLYGSAHAPYGLMDIEGLRNVQQFEIGATYRLKPNLSGLISLNNYALYDKSDGWYGGQSINRRPGGTFIDKTGKSGREIGNEFNIALTYLADKHSTVILEAGLFKPGNFVRAFNKGATTDEYWLGLTYGYKF